MNQGDVNKLLGVCEYCGQRECRCKVARMVISKNDKVMRDEKVRQLLVNFSNKGADPSEWSPEEMALHMKVSLAIRNRAGEIALLAMELGKNRRNESYIADLIEQVVIREVERYVEAVFLR